MAELNPDLFAFESQLLKTKDNPDQNNPVQMGGNPGDLSSDSNMGWSWYMGSSYAGASSTGLFITLNEALQVPIWPAATTRIAADLASLPWVLNHFKSNTGWENVRYHQSLAVLNNPNKRFKGQENIFNLILAFLWYGNAFMATPLWWKGLDVGLPCALIPLLPFLQVSMPYENFVGDLKYAANSKLFMDYRTSDGGDGYLRRLRSEEIIHMRSFTTNNGLWGTSPFSYLADALGIALSAQRIQGNGIRNGLSTQGFLMPKDRGGKEAIDDIRTAWKKANSGYQNAGMPVVAPGGFDWIKTGMTPAEFEMGAVRDRQNAEILRVLHMPGSLMGLTDALGSNYEAEMDNYKSRCLAPIATLLESLLHDKFFPDDIYGDWELKLDFEKLARADATTRTSVAGKRILLGLKTQNDIIDDERWKRNPHGDDFQMMSNTGVQGENGSDLPAADMKDSKGEKDDNK